MDFYGIITLLEVYTLFVIGEKPLPYEAVAAYAMFLFLNLLY